MHNILFFETLHQDCQEDESLEVDFSTMYVASTTLLNLAFSSIKYIKINASDEMYIFYNYKIENPFPTKMTKRIFQFYSRFYTVCFHKIPTLPSRVILVCIPTPCPPSLKTFSFAFSLTPTPGILFMCLWGGGIDRM